MQFVQMINEQDQTEELIWLFTKGLFFRPESAETGINKR
jgi:hypothetical protein